MCSVMFGKTQLKSLVRARGESVDKCLALLERWHTNQAEVIHE